MLPNIGGAPLVNIPDAVGVKIDMDVAQWILFQFTLTLKEILYSYV